jgi:UDP-glucose 4-epimerase
MSILVTGGAGYIGSHTLIALIQAGFEPVVIDNLSNSKRESLLRVEKITGKTIKFYENDVRDANALKTIFNENNIEAVIHFAGFKAVGESVAKPMEYYDNNLTSTFVLINTMREFGVKKIVFSSSATVYGVAKTMPLTEGMPLGAINPYGRTKLFIEEILRDLFVSDNSWAITLLRYFNPIGAHPSAEIGELPNGVPNNLIPFVTQTAAGIRERLSVFGDDYNTPDGTCIRDYINVVDLAKAHVISVQRLLEEKSAESIEIFNLGTGRGLSVKEILTTFEKVNKVKVPHQIVPRREGDIEQVWANPAYANNVLGWEAKETVEDTLKSAWKWQKKLMKKQKKEDSCLS